MPLLVLSLTCLWAPVAYSAEPPIHTAKVSHRKTLGKWFDGRSNRPVEEAVWIAPHSVSRLGWDWSTASRRFQGALTFGVRLAALERQDPWEFGGDTAPNDDPSRVAFSLEALDVRGNAVPLPTEVVVRWEQRGRDPGELLRVSWLDFLYGHPPERLPLGVGRNRIAVYELRSPLTAEVQGAFSYRLRVTTPRRTREAVFRRWPG
ncbi:MAG: hypothetical protein ACO1SV_22775 [Fimbriimonas sp.]